jgi:hypothetical protein
VHLVRKRARRARLRCRERDALHGSPRFLAAQSALARSDKYDSQDTAARNQLLLCFHRLIQSIALTASASLRR